MQPGFSVCTAATSCARRCRPGHRECDGKDNDCDYLTDENLPDNDMNGVQDVQSAALGRVCASPA